MKNKIILRSVNQSNIDVFKKSKSQQNFNSSIYPSKPLNKDTHINAQYKIIKQNRNWIMT